MANSRYEYVKDFELPDQLLPGTFIVVRIDGKSFTAFTRDHDFEKPHDTAGLDLMNAAAVATMHQYPGDIVLAFGHSDEYSFLFRKDTTLYKRRASKLTSLIVSCFTGNYVHAWSRFFPGKALKSVPMFDGRCVLYPSEKTVRDYLAWRQVDVHVNCQYNTCYWLLYREEEEKEKEKEKEDRDGGKQEASREEEASGVDVEIRSRVQGMLKGTLTCDKNEVMFQRGINYNDLPAMWRRGSTVVWEQAERAERAEGGDSGRRKPKRVLRVVHEDIIKNGFWTRRPWVLE